MKYVKEWLILTIAILIVALAVYFFLIPSQTAISSVTSIAVVLSHFVPYKISTIALVMNIVLLIAGVLIVGTEFGVKTCYTTLMLPIMIGVLEVLFPNFESFTHDQLLDVICYVFVVNIGLTILFNRNASSGGLDIVAKIINKFFDIEIGKALIYIGFLVSFSSLFVFDTKSLILSLLGTYLSGIVLDQFIFERTLKRRVCIVSKKEDEIRDFIIHTLRSGASIYRVRGAYKLQEFNEILTIVNRSEYQKLMQFIRRVDPEAFISVYKVNSLQYKEKPTI